ncbi:hypothetical protein [Haloarcula sp. JP-L23]|uniref:hypothetical protein n=1 Tax=Haloarcula sp. JP-L23 TaxID=2716717 RepID=UPI00140E982D|nr:hypothetical protein G9465_23055 [Haloarcula sp. JP-L23]
MADYMTPVTTVFEMQRTTVEQSQKALEQSVAFQQTLNKAVIDSLDRQGSAQRRGVEFSQTAFHSYLDAVEATVPGIETSVDELRTAVDDQYDVLLENHADVFENVDAELQEGAEAYDELTADALDALDEQIQLLVEAHEELETQSVDTVEQVGEQVEELQAQIEDVQKQIHDIQAAAEETDEE